MESEDKRDIVFVALAVFLVLSIIGIIETAEYLDNKLKAEQPKYFIEFKGTTYELKEVE